MGIPTADALGAVRLSIGRSTTAQDIEHVASALSEAWAGATNE
jgi:cysteine sulfinate desulfinase/cysteine desulfurase-like protein